MSGADDPLTAEARRFVEGRRVAHLGTADAAGVPQLQPVCFALDGRAVFIAVDAKPKQGAPRRLKRLRNIAENPEVTLLFDHYEEDWSRLGWVMLRGRAAILEPPGEEHDAALGLLRARYAQYAAMDLSGLPVIAIRIATARHWGRLDQEPRP